MVTGEAQAEYLPYAHQEPWYHYAVAAKALGGSAWELRGLSEPKRTFWLRRGLLMNQAEAEAWEISHPPQNVTK